jgi:uncharacterized protein RhaS with RHS repeats
VGRLAKVTDASGTHEFKYDKLGRVISDKKTVDSVGYQFDRTYDSMGRVRTLTYPDSEVVTYTYDFDGTGTTYADMGDVQKIASASTDYIKEVNYNAAGQITFTKYGNKAQCHSLLNLRKGSKVSRRNFVDLILVVDAEFPLNSFLQQQQIFHTLDSSESWLKIK